MKNGKLTPQKVGEIIDEAFAANLKADRVFLGDVVVWLADHYRREEIREMLAVTGHKRIADLIMAHLDERTGEI